MDELRKPALEALRAGRVRYHPESQHRFAIQSLEDAPDWNISRQIWWGHQLPVWECPDGHITVAETEPEACADCGSHELTRSTDVLDTWFSSALWPFATLGWPEDTEDLRDVLSRRREHDCARHHPALGEPDDLQRARADGRCSVPRRRHPLDRARADRRPDVEEPRHRNESARGDRDLRRGRDALRADEDGVVAGRSLLGGRDRGGPEACEQALERGAADPAGVGGRCTGRTPAHARGALDPRPPFANAARSRAALRRVRLLARGRTSSITSPSTTSATGMRKP